MQEFLFGATRLIRRLPMAFVILACLLISPKVTWADQVVLSTFGSGDTYSTTTGYFVNYTANAVGFDNITPGLHLTRIDLALAWAAGTNLATVQFLRANFSGADVSHSTVLEQWTLIGLPPYSGGGSVVSLNSLVNPSLEIGPLYYIALFPYVSDTEVVWFQNSEGWGGVYASDTPFSVWEERATPTPAYRVFGSDGSPEPPSIPEPSSLALLGLGLAGLAASRRRKQ